VEATVCARRADLDTLKQVKSRLLTGEDRLQKMKWEYEVSQQRFARLKLERDDLFQKFQDAVYDVQQKAGFRGLLLEKKVVLAQTELEKKEAQLTEVRAGSGFGLACDHMCISAAALADFGVRESGPVCDGCRIQTPG
jgi:hypothetical protein